MSATEPSISLMRRFSLSLSHAILDVSIEDSYRLIDDKYPIYFCDANIFIGLVLGIERKPHSSVSESGISALARTFLYLAWFKGLRFLPPHAVEVSHFMGTLEPSETDSAATAYRLSRQQHIRSTFRGLDVDDFINQFKIILRSPSGQRAVTLFEALQGRFGIRLIEGLCACVASMGPWDHRYKYLFKSRVFDVSPMVVPLVDPSTVAEFISRDSRYPKNAKVPRPFVLRDSMALATLATYIKQGRHVRFYTDTENVFRKSSKDAHLHGLLLESLSSNQERLIGRFGGQTIFRSAEYFVIRSLVPCLSTDSAIRDEAACGPEAFRWENMVELNSLFSRLSDQLGTDGDTLESVTAQKEVVAKLKEMEVRARSLKSALLLIAVGGGHSPESRGLVQSDRTDSKSDASTQELVSLIEETHKMLARVNIGQEVWREAGLRMEQLENIAAELESWERSLKLLLRAISTDKAGTFITECSLSDYIGFDRWPISVSDDTKNLANNVWEQLLRGDESRSHISAAISVVNMLHHPTSKKTLMVGVMIAWGFELWDEIINAPKEFADVGLDILRIAAEARKLFSEPEHVRLKRSRVLKKQMSLLGVSNFEGSMSIKALLSLGYIEYLLWKLNTSERSLVLKCLNHGKNALSLSRVGGYLELEMLALNHVVYVGVVMMKMGVGGALSKEVEDWTHRLVQMDRVSYSRFRISDTLAYYYAYKLESFIGFLERTRRDHPEGTVSQLQRDQFAQLVRVLDLHLAACEPVQGWSKEIAGHYQEFLLLKERGRELIGVS